MNGELLKFILIFLTPWPGKEADRNFIIAYFRDDALHVVITKLFKLMTHNMDGKDFQCTSANYPLDSKNAVCLADFDKSTKSAGDPQGIKNDLEVISFIIIPCGQLEDIPTLSRKERTLKMPPRAHCPHCLAHNDISLGWCGIDCCCGSFRVSLNLFSCTS